METGRRIPEGISRRALIWNRSAYMNQTLAIALSILGVLSGLAVAALPDTLGVGGMRALGFASAACVVLLGTVKPLLMGSRYRHAWRILSAACLRFEVDPDFSEADLVAALERGEDAIGDLEA